MSEWSVAIELRHLLDVQLRYLFDYSQPVYGPYDPEFVSNALEVIRHYPTSLEYLDQSRDSIEPAVRDMTVGEMMWTLDDITAPKEQGKDLSPECLHSFRFDEQLMFQSIDDACLTRGNNPLPSSRLALTVDLSKTDDDLKRDFANWVSKKRLRSKTTIGLDWWRRFDKKTFAKWHRYRVLGYIDLELLAKDAGIQLTNAQMTDALYPQPGSDRYDHVRKTVRPLSIQVMSWTTVCALRAAAP